jgi:hypothetical protein
MSNFSIFIDHQQSEAIFTLMTKFYGSMIFLYPQSLIFKISWTYVAILGMIRNCTIIFITRDDDQALQISMHVFLLYFSFREKCLCFSFFVCVQVCVTGIEAKTSWMLGQHTTIWIISMALLFIYLFILFTCAYNVWVISPSFPPPPPFPSQLPPSLPHPPHYQAETILPLSLILLKREYKQ